MTDGLDALEDPLSGSLRWSPDGSELALIGRSDTSPTRVFRYRLAGGSLDAVTDASLEPTSVLWTTGGELLTLARASQGNTDAEPSRADWWLVGAGKAPRKLSGDLSFVPPRLVREEGREAFVGLAGGDVLRLLVADSRWENLTTGFAPGIMWLVWAVGECVGRGVLQGADRGGRRGHVY